MEFTFNSLYIKNVYVLYMYIISKIFIIVKKFDLFLKSFRYKSKPYLARSSLTRLVLCLRYERIIAGGKLTNAGPQPARHILSIQALPRLKFPILESNQTYNCYSVNRQAL